MSASDIRVIERRQDLGFALESGQPINVGGQRRRLIRHDDHEALPVAGDVIEVAEQAVRRPHLEERLSAAPRRNCSEGRT